MAERYKLYCSARDSGQKPPDAALTAGISAETGGRYERSYRQSRNLPPVGPSPGFSHHAAGHAGH